MIKMESGTLYGFTDSENILRIIEVDKIDVFCAIYGDNIEVEIHNISISEFSTMFNDGKIFLIGKCHNTE